MRRRGFLGLLLTPLLPTKADPVDILTSADRELAKILPQLEAYYKVFVVPSVDMRFLRWTSHIPDEILLKNIRFTTHDRRAGV